MPTLLNGLSNSLLVGSFAIVAAVSFGLHLIERYARSDAAVDQPILCNCL